MQSLKILIYMLTQVFFCHFQAMLNFFLSPPSLTLHARLLTADKATAPLFPTFLNSPCNSISLFLIHSAQFSPPPPKSLNVSFQIHSIFQVNSISFLMPAQTGLCNFLLIQTGLTSIWPKIRLWVHHHPSPE